MTRKFTDWPVVVCKLCDEEFEATFLSQMCGHCSGAIYKGQLAYRKMQSAAIHAVGVAIRTRELLHPCAHFCADCGKPAECYDHRDYSKPLDVVPVRRGCNRKRAYSLNMPEHLRRVRGGKAETYAPPPGQREFIQRKLAEQRKPTRRTTSHPTESAVRR